LFTNIGLKSTLSNSTLTVTTSLTLVYNETFQVIKGINTLYLAKRVLFNPNTQNIFYKSINTQLSYSQSNVTGSYDLIWKNGNPNTLQRMIDNSNWKLNLQILTRQYIYQDTVKFDTTFFEPGLYALQFYFGNFSTAVLTQTQIWEGCAIFF
jgi:hypothetical protein